MTERRRVKTVNAADVKAKQLRWLWEPLLPLGFYTDIHGDGKIGKGAMINGHLVPRLCREGLRTLWLTGEDPIAEAIVPRLYAAGLTKAEVALVDFVDCVERTKTNTNGDEVTIEDHFRLPDFVEELGNTVADGGHKFVYLDPVVDFFNGDLNADNNQDVREAIGPLDAMSYDTGSSSSGIRHIGKNRDRLSTHAGLGSVAWRNAARSSVLVGRNPSDTDQRVVAPNGLNYAAEGGGISFRIRSKDVTINRRKIEKVAEVYDVQACSLSADDLLVKAREDTGVVNALEVLNELFATTPMLASSTVLAHLESKHVRREAYDAAAGLLGIVKKQVLGRWHWFRNQEVYDAWWPASAAPGASAAPASSAAPGASPTGGTSASGGARRRTRKQVTT